jgi:protein-tyrosine phosphatase
MSAAASSARFVEIAGALNFRDLGGYPAAEGRTTRWRVLYRSGSGHRISEDDLDRLSARGLRYVFDLRSTPERRDHPSSLKALERITYRFIDHDRLPGDIRRTLRTPNATAGEARAMMMAMYRQLPLLFRGAYAELFRHLENGDLPLVFNCAAGKDRTGVAAALILSGLGVPRDIIREDYLLTERCFEQNCEFILSGPSSRLFQHVRRATWEPVMRADAAYLDAMFDDLIERHGSVWGYLQGELGMSEESLARMRSNLLE